MMTIIHIFITFYYLNSQPLTHLSVDYASFPNLILPAYFHTPYFPAQVTKPFYCCCYSFIWRVCLAQLPPLLFRTPIFRELNPPHPYRPDLNATPSYPS